MANLDLNNVDNMFFDVLREIGNIGAGNAATSLAQMLQTKVDISVPKIDLLEFREVGEAMGGEELLVAGIYLRIEGDLNGSIMFLMEEKSAHELVARLMGAQTHDEHSFSEMELSALKEIGNIITGAYLNSLSTLTNMRITPSVPDLCVDMAGAILSVPAIEFGEMGDKMLMIETTFTDFATIDGYFVLVPDLPSYNKMLSALGL
ncbi:MAG: chemotaxis protein CheC [Lachnospiraceae bacterium]|nr:chemotaxis protein CheC [Lachnospiraceae bacterium]MBR0149371.1 chemotaxis protein CheC [Lachnospiraceae bacterium]